MVARRGFGLVEVIVAMTLLGIGVVTIGAGGALAARVMRLSETEEAAARVAASVLDSISLLPQWNADSLSAGQLRAVWNGGRAGDDVRVIITMPSQPGLSFTWMTTVLPALAPLPSIPPVNGT